MGYIKHKSEESLEDYLETILLLNNRLGNVRSVDIANELNFKKSSVSVAMKNLKELNYIVVGENGYITLTPSGHTRANDILERHNLLTEWLISLGVTKNCASEDACKMEHVISAESYEAIKKCISSLTSKKE